MEEARKHKPIEELNIMDDFLFNEIVMDKEYGESFIRYFLKTILGTDIEITDVKAQLVHTSGDPNKRAIRMDVVTRGTILPRDINPVTGEKKETFIDIEMQKQIKLTKDWKKRNLRHRSRLYQALLDVNLLSSGQHFGEIPNVLIILCMPFDIFERNQIIYTFENRCKEEPDLTLEDGAKRIFLNTKGKIGGSKELQNMLQYIEESNEKNVVNPDLQDIHDLVSAIKQNKKVGARYMLAIEHEQELINTGISKGIEKGIKAFILDNLEENVPKERILNKLQRRFQLSEEEAKEQLAKYC